jgi:nicotinamide-nucleotide amidase
MSLEEARDQLAAVVKTHDTRIVFAESCTAGLCSATMAQVEGISSHLCGSAATYIPELKQAWLRVSPETMKQRTCESQQVADEMARGVLQIAPVAHWSAAVVGHLAGDLECLVYVAVARRDESGEPVIAQQCQRPLLAATRPDRAREAAALVLTTLRETIEHAPPRP